jgi:hypothetical protein
VNVRSRSRGGSAARSVLLQEPSNLIHPTHVVFSS